MKFDQVYDFYKSSSAPTPLSKLQLALYYLSQIYIQRQKFIRIAEIPPISPDLKEIPIEQPTISESIDFTRDDIIDYLVYEGSKISPYA